MKASALLSTALLVLLAGGRRTNRDRHPGRRRTRGLFGAGNHRSGAEADDGAGGQHHRLQGYEPSLKIAVTVVKAYPDRPGTSEYGQPQSGKRFYAR